MRNPTRKAMQGVFGALMVGALGFGASQAFASAPAEAAAYCTREEAADCSWQCQEALGSGWRGRCTKNQFGQISCQCVQIILPAR